jgi:uncharacterized SAM-binding protein YcdF (DUF218 family)
MMALLKDSLPGSIPFLLGSFLMGLILLQWQHTRRWGKHWLWGLFLLYLGFSLPAVSRLLAAPLAMGFTPVQTVAGALGAQAIVVLDSSTRRYGSDGGRLELVDDSSALRALEAARVYRLLDAPLVIVSGGNIVQEMNWAPEASTLRDTLVTLGVPSKNIILDSDSQNTRAHATNVSRFLQARRITAFVLVTSPTHMRRAIAAFNATGSDPIPSPSNSLIQGKRGWEAFWPSPKALAYTEDVMHDYFGLAYYYIVGWA